MEFFYFRRILRVFRRPAPPPVSFLRRFWKESYKKALVVILLIMAVVAIAREVGLFEAWDAFGLDYLVRSRTKDVPTDIFIVEITDDDYKNHFCSKSPLEPAAVLSLLGAIQSANPRVIGVDIDTRDPAWTNVNQEQLNKMHLLEKGSNVVWAMVPAEDKLADKTKERELFIQPVLGGALTDFSKTGVVRFRVDPDGVVRRYRAEFDLAVGTGKVTVPAFPRAVAALKDPDLMEGSTPKEHYFNFSGGHYQFQIVQADEFMGQAANDPKKIETWNRLMGGKAVLIGGSYQAAREEYRTPLGPMDGIELLATAIESEIHPWGVISPMGLAGEMALDFVLATGVVFVYFQFKYHPYYALLIVFAGMLILPFAVSLFAFYFLGWRWISFVPIVAGMLIHQLLESAGQSGELHRELRKSEADLEELRHRLAERQKEVDLLRENEKDRLALQGELEELRAQIKALARRRAAGGSH